MSPIELGFSVFKRYLQQANMTGLSDSAFVHIVGEALAGWGVRSARNSFIHCGFKVDSVEEEAVFFVVWTQMRTRPTRNMRHIAPVSHRCNECVSSLHA